MVQQRQGVDATTPWYRRPDPLLSAQIQHDTDGMKEALKAFAYIFLAIDTIAVIVVLHWALTASARDGESAYAFVFFLISLAFVALGGGALKLSANHGSALGLWCSTLILGLPPVIVVAIRISNSL